MKTQQNLHVRDNYSHHLRWDEQLYWTIEDRDYSLHNTNKLPPPTYAQPIIG